MVRHQLTMHGNILQTEYWKKSNSFYYSFGSRFSRIRNWELGRTVFLCMEFMIKYHEYHQLCKWNCDLIWQSYSTMNRMMCSQWAKYFNFVTVFFLFFSFKKNIHFANGIKEILCHQQTRKVELIQPDTEFCVLSTVRYHNQQSNALRFVNRFTKCVVKVPWWIYIE